MVLVVRVTEGERRLDLLLDLDLKHNLNIKLYAKKNNNNEKVMDSSHIRTQSVYY